MAGLGTAGAVVGVVVGMLWFTDESGKPNRYRTEYLYKKAVENGQAGLVVEQLLARRGENTANMLSLEGVFSSDRREQFFKAAASRNLINPKCAYYFIDLKKINNVRSFDAKGLIFLERQGAQFFATERQFRENCKQRHYKYHTDFGWMVIEALESQPAYSSTLSEIWARNIFLTSTNALARSLKEKKRQFDNAVYKRNTRAEDNAQWGVNIYEFLSSGDLIKRQKSLLAQWQ